MKDKNRKKIISLKKKGLRTKTFSLSGLGFNTSERNKKNYFNLNFSLDIQKRLTLDYYKKVFENSRTRFYKFLENFNDWDDYKLSNHRNKFNSSYLPEVLLERFFVDVSLNYLEKYPFMKKYNDLYPEHKGFIKSLDRYETFDISSKRGGINVKVELFNISEDDLYFPNVEIVYSVHSALHSIATVLKSVSGDLKDFESILLYEKPLLTHIGDREYVLYMAMQLKIPLVILTRKENLSFFLQANGLPKQGHLGRWCTRTFKIESARLFYENFFYPFIEKIRYVMNKEEIKALAKERNITIPKTLIKRNEIAEYIIKTVQEKELTPKNSTYSKKFKIPNQANEPDNLVQCMGIAAYQSKRRSKMNPDLKLTHYSNDAKKFLIYELLPIFEMPFPEIKKMFEGSDLIENPYDSEYRNLNTFYMTGTKEIRFGCNLCPYKDITYYGFQRDNYSDRYYYNHLIRTIASAKNIIRDGKEYYYYNEKDTPKKHAELKWVM